MRVLRRFREWLNSLGSGPGGKRIQRYATQTSDGQAILVESTEAVIGNAEAAQFFRDLCGGSLREIMQRAGASNVLSALDDEAPVAAPGHAATPQQMAMFRKYGVRFARTGDLAVFAKPSTYPHVEIGKVQVLEDEPADGRPLVIKSAEADQVRPLHATVVFTVFEPARQARQKQVTVHFHGRGLVRAKGFVRETGAMGRPTHWEGDEVRRLVERRARPWLKKIHWCSSTERY